MHEWLKLSVIAGIGQALQASVGWRLSDWLRTTQSVFVLAGDCYGMDHYFRVGIGAEERSLVAGLSRVRDALKERFGV